MFLSVAGLPAPPRSFMMPQVITHKKMKSCKKELIAICEEEVSRYLSSPLPGVKGVIIIPESSIPP